MSTAPSLKFMSLVLAVFAAVATTRSQAAAELGGEEILRKSLNTYSSAQNYRCEGRISEERTVQNRGMSDDGPLVSDRLYDMAVNYQRSGKLEAKWSGGGSYASRLTGTGSIQMLDGSYVLTNALHNGESSSASNVLFPVTPHRFATMNEVIDASESSSRQFLTILREFLDPAFHGDLLASTVKNVGTANVAGTRCHVLQLSGSRNCRIWIDSQSFAIRKMNFSVDLENELTRLRSKLDDARRNKDPDVARIETRLERRENYKEGLEHSAYYNPHLEPFVTYEFKYQEFD